MTREKVPSTKEDLLLFGNVGTTFIKNMAYKEYGPKLMKSILNRIKAVIKAGRRVTKYSY